MSTLLIIIVLILLFGGGGGFYAHSRYGGAGLGGVLGTVLVVILVLWLVGRSISFRFFGSRDFSALLADNDHSANEFFALFRFLAGNLALAVECVASFEIRCLVNPPHRLARMRRQGFRPSSTRRAGSAGMAASFAAGAAGFAASLKPIRQKTEKNAGKEPFRARKAPCRRPVTPCR